MSAPRCPDGTRCLVCSRWKDDHRPAPVTLPSGRTAPMCDECAADRFQIAEAARRLDEQERKTA